MKGHFKKRGCICPPKNCTCGKKWSFVIDMGKDPETGKRKQMTKGGFKTRKEAEDAAAAQINEINQGTFIKESYILFKDWANEWLSEYIRRNGPKPSTIRLRQYGINKLLFYFAHLKLKNITEVMYQVAFDDLINRNLTRTTVKGIHTTGKLIFKMAVAKKKLKENPTVNIQIMKHEQMIIEDENNEECEENEEDLPKFFEKNELAEFLNIVKEKGLFMDDLIFNTLSYTGMRVGELVALKWKDIDFDNNTIRINKTYYNPENNTTKYKLVRPKTKKSKRVIDVDADLIKIFRKYKEEQDQIISRLGNRCRNRGFVFSNLKLFPGYPIMIKFVENRMARLLKYSGLLPKLTPHGLRHTHTSLLAQAKVELDEIKDRLGHEDDDVTEKIYLHVTEQRKKEASDKFSNLMRGLK